MCWSEGASLAMVGVGVAATVVTARRGEPVAIPATLGFFAVMEALQVGGYWVIDECTSGANQSFTLLSYLHIAFQPIFINAFGMAIIPGRITPAIRRLVFALSGLATLLIVMRLVPFNWAGQCRPGDILCGPALCTISGTWHLGWEVPLNDMWHATGAFRKVLPFPAYIAAVFILPLFYGAWRYVLYHAALGPLLAMFLTDNPNEMPAIWCLFSVGLALIGLSPMVRQRVLGRERRAVTSGGPEDP